MQSHSYNITKQDLVRLVLFPLLPLAFFAVAVHFGAVTGIFPDPLPILDTDRTIVLHQAAATRQTHSAELILIGDSSCLMDVAATRLNLCASNGQPALNLGTLSYLDLRSYAALLQSYFSRNSGIVRTVVLLMHPEALRQASSADYYDDVLDHYYSGLDYCEPDIPRPLCWLGVTSFRGRFLARFMPLPLNGGYGQKYGFTKNLWDYLSENKGSAVDPGIFDSRKAQGNSEYRLAKTLESAGSSFANAIPKQVKLLVGITPIPESQALRDYPQTSQEMLRQLGRWLEADTVLAQLPPTLPDHWFATKTHLNEEGQRQYTDLLCHVLNVALAH